uniref:Uncharacterized protein n=1 Tax=Glossina brevipalpis TaxID=37001 RepID=A0A1A9X4P5_9MUSC
MKKKKKTNLQQLTKSKNSKVLPSPEHMTPSPNHLDKYAINPPNKNSYQQIPSLMPCSPKNESGIPTNLSKFKVNKVKFEAETHIRQVLYSNLNFYVNASSNPSNNNQKGDANHYPQKEYKIQTASAKTIEVNDHQKQVMVPQRHRRENLIKRKLKERLWGNPAIFLMKFKSFKINVATVIMNMFRFLGLLMGVVVLTGSPLSLNYVLMNHYL